MAGREEQGEQGREPAGPAVRGLPVVIELPPFTQKWGQYRLTEDDRTVMLSAILSDPTSWPVQKGISGARKARFSTHDMDCGASGGYRVLYADFPRYGKVVLITLFPKSMQSNLSKAGRNLVVVLLREIEGELEQIDREERSRGPGKRRR